jgi:hypothetical protein
MRGQRRSDGGNLKFSKCGLSVIDEDVRDRFTGVRFNVLVRVTYLNALETRKYLSNGGLPGSGRSGKHDEWLGCH